MPMLYVSEMGYERRLPLGEGIHVVGRDPGNHVFLKHPDISKRHCEIVREGDRYRLRDLASRNGTFVNEIRTPDCLLQDGDAIQIGDAVLVYLESASASSLISRNAKERLGEMCVRKGVIGEAELRKALEIQAQTHQKLGEILVEHGLADADLVLETLGEQLMVPWIDLTRCVPSPKAVSLFTRGRAKQWFAVPLYIMAESRRLVVAMADVGDLKAIEEMEFFTYFNIDALLAKKADIQAAIDRIYPSDSPSGEWPQLAHQPPAPALLAGDGDEKGASKLVQSILEEAVRSGASDVHIEPRRDKVVVRFRIDGILHEKKVIPLEIHAGVVNRIKILAGMDITEKRFPQDGHQQVTVDKHPIDIRVASLPTARGEKLVMRIHNLTLAGAAIEALGMNPDVREQFSSMVTKPEGLLIVAGPTGSGKSTTLYAALNHVKSTQKNVITLENPIELEIDGINQAQVYDHPSFNFASGLRAILRQDPNIILVGEVRDAETAQIGIQAALTGHLVLTTLHTNSAAGAIARLIDMGIEPYLITASLLGVLSQRLVRKICPSCKEPHRPSEDLLKACFEALDVRALKLFRGKGCAKCPDGYSGRTAVFELLVCTDRLRRLIVDKATTSELRAKAREGGMGTLREDAVRMAVAGMTTLEEVLRVTYAEF